MNKEDNEFEFIAKLPKNLDLEMNASASLFKELIPGLVNQYPDFNDILISLEQLAFKFGKLSYPFSFSASFLSCIIPVLKYGKSNLDNDMFNKIISGENIVANCATESASGSDVYSMSTSIRKDDTNYILNGHKVFVTNSGIATFALVYAKNNDTKRIETLLVDLNSNGVELFPSFSKMGLKNSTLGQISFTDVVCSKNCILSEKKSGKEIFSESMLWERMGLAAVHIGIIRNILQLCKRILNEDRITDQNIWHSISYIWTKMEAVKLLLYNTDRNTNNFTASASMCKLLSSTLFIEMASLIPNWIGYQHLSNPFISEFILDAPATSIYSGTNEIHKEIISSYFKIQS